MNHNERDYVCHIMAFDEWAGVDEIYAPPSIDAEGFIHFSYPDQLLATAERYYRGVEGLCVLLVPVSAIEAELVVEATVGTEPFPHLYRPLRASEVRDVKALRIDGARFVFPDFEHLRQRPFLTKYGSRREDS